MSFPKLNFQSISYPKILAVCFISFSILSWVLLFRDPRAIIGISNLYPFLKTFLFSTQEYLSNYGLNSWPTIFFGITAIIAFSSYIRSLTVKISLKKTVVFAVIFQVITFTSFPILSTDIFSYIFSERVSTVHNENIWKVKPSTFPDDQFGVMADWKDTTSVYGGVNYLLYLGPSNLAGDNLLLLTVLYKLVPAIFAMGAMYILYLLLKLYEISDKEKMLRVVFWNPLFVLETLGSGHNDMVMIFFALLSVLLFKRKLWLIAGIVFALSVQVKLISIVLFIFFLFSLYRAKSYLGAHIFLIGFVVVNLFSFYFMQVSPVNFLQRVAYNGGVYWQSLPNLIQTFFPGGTVIVSALFSLWLVLFVIYQYIKRFDPIYSYVVVMSVYLLFVTSAYWNWYVLWILPFIPLIKNKKIYIMVLVLSITSLFAYPLLWVIHRINTKSLLWPVITYLFIFTPPILIYFITRLKEKLVLKIFRKIGVYEVIA